MSGRLDTTEQRDDLAVIREALHMRPERGQTPYERIVNAVTSRVDFRRALVDREGMQAEIEAVVAALLEAERVALVNAAERARERDEWLSKQLDGCIKDARIVADLRPFAIARALVRNLEDARAALAALAPAEPAQGEQT